MLLTPAARSQQSPPSQEQAPLLTLQDAVALALQNNRLVKNSALDVEKYNYEVNTIRTRRLPHFQFARLLGGQLLHSFDFTFQPGVFGTYPGIGQVPGTTGKSARPAQFANYTTAGLDQPVTQQYKIHLAIHVTELGREIAREDVRAQRQKIANEVRTAYFDLVSTQAAVDAARETVKALEEVQQVTTRHEVEKTVLRVDALEVNARLAKAQYELSEAEDGLATQREHLNQLLGRDVATQFRPDPMLQDDPTDLTLAAARRQAFYKIGLRSAKQNSRRNRPSMIADLLRRSTFLTSVPLFSISELTMFKCSLQTSR